MSWIDLDSETKEDEENTVSFYDDFCEYPQNRNCKECDKQNKCSVYTTHF